MQAITALGQQLAIPDTRKALVMGALRRFAHQRPGLDPRNYISGWNDTEGRRAYFAEARSITRDLRHFRELFTAVENRNISADDLIRHADGRLTIVTERNHECACGIHWAAPVKFGQTQNLSGELTAWCPKCGKRPLISWSQQMRVDYCTGQYWPTEYRPAACRVLAAALWDYWRSSGYDTSDKIRAMARRTLSRGVASRWFQ